MKQVKEITLRKKDQNTLDLFNFSNGEGQVETTGVNSKGWGNQGSDS